MARKWTTTSARRMPSRLIQMSPEEPRGAFSDFFLDRTAPRALNPQSLEHTATVLRWKWTNLPRC